MSVVELWADKERKEEEEGKKRTRQKEEINNEVFKRSKLLARLSISGKEKKGGRENGENKRLTILKEIKEEMTDLRKLGS